MAPSGEVKTTAACVPALKFHAEIVPSSLAKMNTAFPVVPIWNAEVSPLKTMPVGAPGTLTMSGPFARRWKRLTLTVVRVRFRQCRCRPPTTGCRRSTQAPWIDEIRIGTLCLSVRHEKVVLLVEREFSSDVLQRHGRERHRNGEADSHQICAIACYLLSARSPGKLAAMTRVRKTWEMRRFGSGAGYVRRKDLLSACAAPVCSSVLTR